MTNKIKIVASMLLIVQTFAQLSVHGQTRITAPKNNFPLSEDVKIGREGADEQERKSPMISDQVISRYIQSVYDRLVASVPAEFQRRDFHYTVKLVNSAGLNAFALPGGSIFVNRGLIEAAANEDELAGVMAHELSHAVLRHGTAQLTRYQEMQPEAIFRVFNEATVRRVLGSLFILLNESTNAGVLSYIRRDNREDEIQADQLGAQIMARASYNPRSLASMFRTLKRRENNRRVPFWIADHPDTTQRIALVEHEASLLGTAKKSNLREFETIKATLRNIPYPVAEDGGAETPSKTGSYQARIERPSGTYKPITEKGFKISFPDNWNRAVEDTTIIFSPAGAYGEQGITHGVMLGHFKTQSANLQTASQSYVVAMLKANSYLRQEGDFSHSTLNRQSALLAVLSGISPVTKRREIVTIRTLQFDSKHLLYLVSVVPQDEVLFYKGAFQNVADSLQITRQ